MVPHGQLQDLLVDAFLRALEELRRRAEGTFDRLKDRRDLVSGQTLGADSSATLQQECHQRITIGRGFAALHRSWPEHRLQALRRSPN